MAGTFLQRQSHGDYAEDLIKAEFAGQGFEHLGPWRGGELCPEGSHDYDHRFTAEDGHYILGDSKAKARRNLYPDTGVSLKYFLAYLDAYEKAKDDPLFIDFLLLFIDEHPSEARIYCLSFRELEREPEVERRGLVHVEDNYQGGIVYFSLELMHEVRPLLPEELKTLRELSRATRSRGYE
jgi:hypothetical protein